MITINLYNTLVLQSRFFQLKLVNQECLDPTST